MSWTLLLGLVLGGLLGGAAAWLAGLGRRRAARRLRNKVGALENEVAVLKKREQSAQAEGYRTRRGLATQGAPN